MRTTPLLLLLAGCFPSTAPSSELAEAFASAADTYDVPVEVLVATSYSLSRFDQRYGAVNREGGVGVMNLRKEGEYPSLDTAAALIRVHPDMLADDPVANIEGAAALLHAEALELAKRTGEPVDTLEEWYPLVAAWSGSADPLVADGFARQVFDRIEGGISASAPSGEHIELAATSLPWRDDRVTVSGSGLIDQFIPACSDNYSDYSRGTGDITTVVIHTMEGSYSGSISWMQNCSSSVSAHYAVRSSDGEITQLVQEEDVAWHAGHWDTNEASIGIEQEGYVDAPDTWYTDVMYRSTAALVRDICDRRGIPKDRTHIIGHNEVPGCSVPGGGGSSCHTDPGSGWDWDYFMSLVNESGSGSSGFPESSGSDSGSGSGSGSGVADGARSGSFSGRVASTRYGLSDSCSGAVTGAVSGGSFYLSGTCTLVGHPDQVKDVPVVWSGSVSGTTLSGRMVVEGHDAGFSGTVSGDGTLTANIVGAEDLGGDIGEITFEVSLSAAP